MNLSAALVSMLPVFVGLAIGLAGAALSRRHRHGPWVVVGSEYQPPSSRGFEGYSQATIDRILYGVTTVTYRCEGCGDHRTELLSGKAQIDLGRVT